MGQTFLGCYPGPDPSCTLPHPSSCFLVLIRRCKLRYEASLYETLWLTHPVYYQHWCTKVTELTDDVGRYQ